MLALLVISGTQSDGATNFWFGFNGGPLDGAYNWNPPTYRYPGQLCSDGVLRGKSFDHFVRMGANWFRNYAGDGIEYSWRWCEPKAPTNGVHAFRWNAWDLLAQKAQEHGINLMASTGCGTPAWANGGGDRRQKPTDLYLEPMEDSNWYQFIHALVERYDGDGTNDMPGLTKPIKYWSTLNEPDLLIGGSAWEFNGTVQDYVRMLQVAYTAAKAADPTITILAPESAGRVANESGPTSWQIWRWLDFTNAGGLAYVDIITFHYYHGYPDGLVDDSGFEGVFGAASSASLTQGKPVWLTETGARSDGVSTNLIVNQAQYMTRFCLLSRKYPRIAKVFWYDYHEGDNDWSAGGVPKTNLVAYGMLQTHSGNWANGAEPDPQFRQGYLAYRALAGALDGLSDSTVPVALSGLPANVAGYRFEENGRKTLVFWNASSGTVGFNYGVGTTPLTKVNIWGELLATNATGTVGIEVDGSPVYLTSNPMLPPYFVAGRVSSTNAGAHVPSAILTLTGAATGTTASDSEGNYLFPNLPAGVYTVTPSVTNGGTHQFTPASRTISCSWTVTLGRVSFKMDNANPVLAVLTNRSVKLGSTTTFTLSATDADGDPISFSKNAGSVGTLTGAEFAYTPTVAEGGTTNRIAFTASDGLGGSQSRSITISVDRVTINGTRSEWLSLYNLGTDANDDDGDGMLTWQEYLAGTDPTNAASVLTLVGAGIEGGSNYIQWLGGTSSFPYVSSPYLIQARTNLVPGQGNWLSAGSKLREAGTNTWWEPLPPAGLPRYYRIGVTN